MLPLSSKSHWDVPVRIGRTTLHLLASHPTPPAFDGPEDRNGRRNHDEIRFWSDYLRQARHTSATTRASAAASAARRSSSWATRTPIPWTAAACNDAIGALLAHPRVDARFVPQSAGGAEASAAQGGANAAQRGDPRSDTADFNDRVAGNLRVDYLLPSKGMHGLRRRRVLAGADRPGRGAGLGRPPGAELGSPARVARRQRSRSSMPTGQ